MFDPFSTKPSSHNTQQPNNTSSNNSLNQQPATKTPFCLYKLCKVPSPFIMSHNRKACVTHQKNLFHHQTFTKPITAEHKSLHRQNKFTHVTQLYNDWRSKKSKRIYSNPVLAFTGIWNLETCIPVSSSSIPIDCSSEYKWNTGILEH
jgi:hypothetical protein